MKKFLFVLLAMFLVFTLVGCGDSNEGGTKTKKTVITYCNWNFGTEEDNNLTRRRVEAFNKQSDKYRIEIVMPIDGSSYDDFLATLAAAGARFSVL